MDNAKDARQVKPLIPPAGCTLLVTSRQHFALPGLQIKNLETLPPLDAKALLLRIAPRINGEAEAIARLCGYLPQALRLAASAIAVRVSLEPHDYARQLADEKKRLALLAGDNESITASITLSYNLLDIETKKHWRTIAVFPGTFDAPAAAAVWEIDSDAAQGMLSSMLLFSMLEWNDATKRHSMHDLMRDFARQRLTPAESGDPARRHARYYGTALATANRLYNKGGESLMRGLALFDLERGNIEAGQTWVESHSAQDHEAAKLCSGYPTWGVYILDLRQHPREQIHWGEAALSAARQLRDRSAEGRTLSYLATAFANLGDNRRAIEYYEEGLATARETGDRRGEGQDLCNMGNAYDRLGDHHRAIEYYEGALAILRKVGDRQDEDSTLGNLGIAYANLGDTGRAIECYEKSLATARETGNRRGEGQALGNLGNAYYVLGDYRRAIEFNEKALGIYCEIGDRRGEGSVEGNLGNAYADLAETRRAVGYYEKQLEITRAIDDRRGEGNALYNMSGELDKLGDRKKAIENAEAALKIFEQIESPAAAKVRTQLDIWRKG